MHNRKLVSEQQAVIPKLREGISPAVQLVSLVYMLSTELARNPHLYLTQDHRLWISYDESRFSAASLLEEYAVTMAGAARQYPLAVCGTVNGYESGEVSAQLLPQQNKLQLCKRNLSGKEFDLITNLCVRVQLSSSREAQEMLQIIRQVDFQNDFLALERTQWAEELFSSYPQYSADTFYRYLPFVPLDTAGAYTDSLSVEQKQKLWELFLTEGFSPVEFEDTLELMNTGILVSSYSWELALRLALDSTGVQVQNDSSGYRVLDAQGRRMIFDYAGSRAAERLFLKLLFTRAAG